MDVIKAAQEISEYGAKLNAFARQIGSESVESNTKKDLFAYLERITLFCHQLNVTSKVLLFLVKLRSFIKKGEGGRPNSWR